jgi:hypothetical protein
MADDMTKNVSPVTPASKAVTGLDLAGNGFKKHLTET